jgi:hypothetical protein
MFTPIGIINDINKHLNNATIYKTRFLKIEDNEYWLQYCHMSFKNTIQYKVEGEQYGCAAVQLIKKEDDGIYFVYKYNGTLIIDRHLENSVIFDNIENIIEFENDIKEYFCKDFPPCCDNAQTNQHNGCTEHKGKGKSE